MRSMSRDARVYPIEKRRCSSDADTLRYWIATATALSTTLRPAIAIHTAMQTSTLHSTPRRNASQAGSPCLASAIRTTVRPIAPSFIPVCPLANTSSASPAAPTKFAAHTSAQLRATSAVLIRPSAQAIASRLLPVNSSAPATTTSSRPSENTRPPTSWLAARPSVASARTITNSIEPRPMKAPASTPSISRGSVAMRALATPTVSTRRATSSGA